MPSASQELRNAGLKVTAPRIKVFQILASASIENRHLSAEDVYRQLTSSGQDITLGTVYRVLSQFEAAGLVLRRNFESGRSLFELATEDRHEHMVCLASGEVIEFTDPTIEVRQQEFARQLGYELIDYALVLYVRKKEPL